MWHLSLSLGATKEVDKGSTDVQGVSEACLLEGLSVADAFACNVEPAQGMEQGGIGAELDRWHIKEMDDKNESERKIDI